MIFTARGSKLSDALECPPANDAESIYLNHNGQHYESRRIKGFPRQIVSVNFHCVFTYVLVYPYLVKFYNYQTLYFFITFVVLYVVMLNEYHF